MAAEETTVKVDVRALAGLETEVSQLADLFKRRLLEDRSKNALIESVQEQVRTVSDLLRHRELEDLFKESLLAIDRLRSEPSTPELVDSVVDELLEVFRRRGLVEVDDTGDFDPHIHEAVGTVEASSESKVNAITAVHRKGYILSERLLRPAQVTVAVSTNERSLT